MNLLTSHDSGACERAPAPFDGLDSSATACPELAVGPGRGRYIQTLADSLDAQPLAARSHRCLARQACHRWAGALSVFPSREPSSLGLPCSIVISC